MIKKAVIQYKYLLNYRKKILLMLKNKEEDIILKLPKKFKCINFNENKLKKIIQNNI